MLIQNDLFLYGEGQVAFKVSFNYFFRFNLTTERFSQTLAFPPESYKKQSITYHLKKHGRMIEVISYKAIGVGGNGF